MKKEDLQKLKLLRTIISQGEYKITGDAVVHIANLLVWFDKMVEELSKDAPPPSLPSPKIKKDSIKKMGK